MRKNLSLGALLIWFVSQTNAQQTMGLFLNEANSFNGYTLFAPMTSDSTYLIDNCGKVVHTWNSVQRPGASVYLLENGSLLRTGMGQGSNISSGGAGGIIEMLDWNSNVQWSYSIADSTQRAHHDVCYMPNGNILAIVWDLKSQEEALEAGRNPASLSADGLWPEKIVEIEPIGSDSAHIVWEWHTWDHLIQSYDNTKSNYGVVEDHPELIHLNYAPGQPAGTDWLHFNSVDYNPNLDQIVISNHNFCEIWIIDHSTTTAEAAGHTGGNSGMGGDLLYRWGNPYAYGAGLESDQVLWGQHDARWITEGLPGEDNITIYNNGRGRVPAFSTIEEIEAPVNGYNYTLSGQVYGPVNSSWQYVADPASDFYSSNISGAHRLPNGNTIICEGANGHFFEVDSLGNTVWDYVNPIGQGGLPLTQGDAVTQNAVFRCTRLAPDYLGLQGHTLVAGNPIELQPLPDNCSIMTSSIGLENKKELSFEIYPNPAKNVLNISSSVLIMDALVSIYSINGQLVEELNWRSGSANAIINLETYPAGIYSLRISDGKAFTNQLFSVVK